MVQSRPKLLVTGGAGFIGSHFVDLAVQQGYDVTVLDALTYAGSRTNIASTPHQFVEGDICDAGLVKGLFEKDSFHAVIHFAAESHVDRSILGPGEFIRTNVQGTQTLLEQSLIAWRKSSPVLRESFRFIQISTDEVFGSLGPEGSFTETHPYQPNSPYAASKAAADLIVRAYCKTYGLPCIITHCSNNYGPRQFPEKLIPHMIQSALLNRPLGVYGKGTNVRDWLHVTDHCQGVLLALEKGKPGAHYCFGGGKEMNNLEIVQLLCHLLDESRPRSDGQKHESKIQFVEDRLGHDFRYSIDSSFAQKELGYRAKVRFDSGLKETVQWYLQSKQTQEAEIK